MLRCAFLLCSLLLFLPAVSAAQTRTPATVIRTVDGDTLKVRMGRYDERVRMIGIDTPEKEANEKAFRDTKRTRQSIETITSQGRASWDHLNTLLKPGQTVYLEYDVSRSDRHRRLLAYVYSSDGKMLNERMLRDGYASPLTVPPNVRYAKLFSEAYHDARTNKRGLWAQ